MKKTKNRQPRQKAGRTVGIAGPVPQTSQPGASSRQQTITAQQALELGLQHHSAGRLSEAENIYQQVLQNDPEQPIALHLLGVIAHQMGKCHNAVELITKAITISPDLAEAHNNLGNVLKDIGRNEDALTSYNKALEIEPDYAEAHYNCGNVLNDLEKLNEAVERYGTAISIRPDFVEAHFNLGNTLKDLRQLDEAILSYQKAVAINPKYTDALTNIGNILKDLGRLDEAITSYHQVLDIRTNHAEIYYNLGIALQHQGKLDEALQLLQSAVEKLPGNTMITDALIDILDYHMPKIATHGVHAKAQAALQRVTPESTGMLMITDEIVYHLYDQCHTILVSHGLNDQNVSFQFWRGRSVDKGCNRHKVVFDALNIIPEYCFGCYKVLIEPQTVMELFKLMLVFDGLELPNDNTRKCLVEIRPEISGAYKGLIYCQDLDEAKEIEKIVQIIIGKKISDKMPVSVKRGCSEYPVAYPEYAYTERQKESMMTYNEEWRKQEAYADENLVGFQYPPVFETHNHSGFTLHDVVVMQTWLSYAATKGDHSYLDITKYPMKELPIEKRQLFQTIKDNYG